VTAMDSADGSNEADTKSCLGLLVYLFAVDNATLCFCIIA
jgi:hypothetical protein